MGACVLQFTIEPEFYTESCYQTSENVSIIDKQETNRKALLEELANDIQDQIADLALENVLNDLLNFSSDITLHRPQKETN